MQYPNLSNSSQNIQRGEKRFNQAIELLGEDVVCKILCFSLYLLGYPHNYIKSVINCSESGVKKIIREILNNGVERFIDKRRKSPPTNVVQSQKNEISKPKVETKNVDNTFFEFQFSGFFSFKIKKEDNLLKKILSLLCMDSALLHHSEVATILNCKRQTVYQNLKKLKSVGTKGLIDNRKGQENEYKFTTEVKREIINGYLLTITENNIPTKTTISNYLNNFFTENFSERAVALHLKEIGLTENKKDIISKIANHINNRIDSHEYLRPWDKHTEPMKYIEPIKKIKEELNEKFSLELTQNFFEVEQKVEIIQSNLQPFIFKSLFNEIKNDINFCPHCRSHNINIGNSNNPKEKEKTLKLSFGNKFILSDELSFKGKCNDCKLQFNLYEDILKLPRQIKYTPLTMKKICSANRAGSYEGAAKNLKELVNLEINRSEVRKVSNTVGEYIIREFKELHQDITDKLPDKKIYKRHPLINALKIDEKYFDKTKYLIAFSIDGGRMQLFSWLPPENEEKFEKGKKKLYWHENKVFRISIYDKTQLAELSDVTNDSKEKKTYKAAQMVPDSTTFGATNVCWKETAPLIMSHLYVRGIKPDDIDVCLSDGSELILNEILTPIFPGSLHILDYYHKVEALHNCLNAIDIDENFQTNLKNYLWEGKINKLLRELKAIQMEVGIPEGKRNPDNPKVKLDNLINHLKKNKNRLKYKQFREQKLPIGSGSIESAVKLFGKRVKGTEKQWNENGGEAILNLYAFLLSEDNRWDKLWELQTPWLYKPDVTF